MVRAVFKVQVMGLLCILFFSLASHATEQGRFERKFQINGSAQLDVHTGSGDVAVHSGPAGAVTVIGRIHVSNRWLMGGRSSKVQEIENNPPVRQDGNTIHIEPTNLNNISVDYEITVPSETQVHSRTGSGDVRIQDLSGDLDLQSGSGDVWLQDIGGNVQTRSGSGDVRANAIRGRFSADASSGDIRLEKRGQGDIEIHTTSGNIEVTGADGAMRLEAGSGDVSAEGKPVGNWEVRTGSGNIQLNLPRDAGVQLDASTSSGEININHAVTVTVQGRLDSAHSLKGTVGSGGPLVTVRTGSGDISIE